jgi:hypothetical protein
MLPLALTSNDLMVIPEIMSPFDPHDESWRYSNPRFFRGKFAIAVETRKLTGERRRGGREEKADHQSRLQSDAACRGDARHWTTRFRSLLGT